MKTLITLSTRPACESYISDEGLTDVYITNPSPHTFEVKESCCPPPQTEEVEMDLSEITELAEDRGFEWPSSDRSESTVFQFLKCQNDMFINQLPNGNYSVLEG